jgi:hypothetical protein
MALGQEGLRIEVVDLGVRSSNQKHADKLAIALDEDEEFAGIRIDVEETRKGSRGMSFWITKERYPDLFEVFKKKVVPVFLESARKGGENLSFDVVKK